MERATRVAVIGVGSLGQHHARIYAELPQAELCTVVDIDASKARGAAQSHNCRPLTDVAELPSEIEAVSLAVPTVDHAAIACPLLERGIDVLVEKPMASTLGEADAMLESARRGGALLHVGHSERFNPAFRAVRGEIHRPGFFEGHRLSRFVPRSLDIDVVLDLMIHDLDLVLSLVEAELVDVRAVGIPILTERMDIANARLEFADGCVANLTSSRVSTERVRKLRLFQPHDYISMDLLDKEIEMFTLTSGPLGRGFSKRSFSIEDREPLRTEIELFLAGDGQGVDGAQGRRALDAALRVNNAIAARGDDRWTRLSPTLGGGDG